jgi:hypothetical protein
MFYLLLLPYLVVALFTFRCVAPRIAWSEARRGRQSKPDDSDKEFGALCGFFAGIAWPAVIPLILICKTGLLLFNTLTGSKNLWDEPKPIENPVKAIKRARIEKQRQEIIQHREFVNEKERELDMPLTQWN